MIGETLSALILAAGGDYSKVEETDGVLIESRPVTGSNIVELRLTTSTTRTVTSLCDAAFGEGKFDPEEPDLKSRKILTESENERVTYDQISPPVVANRDYAVRAKRIRTSDDLCVMTFEAANELAPPRPDGWVRIMKLKGEWRFERADGRTKITYVIFSDPAGSIPAFMVEGSRRKIALRWIKMLLGRSKD
jgi:hypothetical protein